MPATWAAAAVGLYGIVQGGKANKEAAAQNAAGQAQAKEIAEMQMQISREQLDLAKEQWNNYLTTYQPLNEMLSMEAMTGVEPRYDERLGDVTADVEQAYNLGEESFNRNLERSGLNPSDPQYASMMEKRNRSKTKDLVAGRNLARQGERDRAENLTWGKRFDVASMGKGLPSQAAAMAGQAGNSAGGAGVTMSNAMRNNMAMNNSLSQNQYNQNRALTNLIYRTGDLFKSSGTESYPGQNQGYSYEDDYNYNYDDFDDFAAGGLVGQDERYGWGGTIGGMVGGGVKSFAKGVVNSNPITSAVVSSNPLLSAGYNKLVGNNINAGAGSIARNFPQQSGNQGGVWTDTRGPAPWQYKQNEHGGYGGVGEGDWPFAVPAEIYMRDMKKGIRPPPQVQQYIRQYGWPGLKPGWVMDENMPEDAMREGKYGSDYYKKDGTFDQTKLGYNPYKNYKSKNQSSNNSTLPVNASSNNSIHMLPFYKPSGNSIQSNVINKMASKSPMTAAPRMIDTWNKGKSVTSPITKFGFAKFGFAEGGAIGDDDVDYGLINGPGTGTSDSIPAVEANDGRPIRVSDGEYIFSKAAVDLYGKDRLDEMNNLGLQYRAGGLI